jgi:hypothetical protein
MSIDPTKAEAAQDFLRESAKEVGPLTKQAKLKASMVKHVEGLLVKMQDNSKVPVSVRQAYARAEERYLEAIVEDAEAAGELAGIEARRDAAKSEISFYQSQVKDRS